MSHHQRNLLLAFPNQRQMEFRYSGFSVQGHRPKWRSCLKEKYHPKNLRPPTIDIPLSRPTVAPRTLEIVNEALISGAIEGSARGYAGKCADALEGVIPGSRVVMTNSCSGGLEAAAMVLRDLNSQRDAPEVIVPSFTHPATASAFIRSGFNLVFAEARLDNGNIDEDHVAALISSNTAAVVAMHYGGHACEMDRLIEVSNHHGIALVEDNAHGLFGTYKNRPLGSFGIMSATSFHQSKNLTCGEGGALFVNRSEHLESAEMTVDHGTDRQQFLKDLVDAYQWRCLGANLRMSGISAAVLWAQLSNRDAVQSSRRQLWHRYRHALEVWAQRAGVGLPPCLEDRESSYHLFYLRCRSAGHREELCDLLSQNGIEAAFHFQPLHSSEFGRSLGYRRGQLPNVEGFAETVLRIPLFADMDVGEQDRVIEAVTSGE